MNRTIRPMKLSEVELMINYFHSAEDDFLRGMGADPSKLPTAEDWFRRLAEDFSRSRKIRELYYLVWMAGDIPIGHSNINNIVFGQEAFVHLHIWEPKHRRSGCAAFYLAKSVDQYFEMFELEKLCCEPFAKNPAPNKVLPKVGFQLVRTYETIPGPISFRQCVNRWELDRKRRITICDRE